jgi:hypothetical protein
MVATTGDDEAVDRSLTAQFGPISAHVQAVRAYRADRKVQLAAALAFLYAQLVLPGIFPERLRIFVGDR